MGPIDSIFTLPNIIFVPGDIYGKAILATHTKVCNGTVAPGTIMSHADIHAAVDE